MKLTILGCNGGVASNKYTTSFLIDDDIVIDAGTGLGNLQISQMRKIKTIFITHSHLDHICHLPFLLNNFICEEDYTLDIYTTADTISSLKKYIFNNIIWPDFTQLPSKDNPCIKFHAIKVGESKIIGKREIIALPSEHTECSLGFWVGDDAGKGSFAFSGDSRCDDDFWRVLNNMPEVKALIMDMQYMDSEEKLSRMAKHYHTSLLHSSLQKLSYQPELYSTHLPAKEGERVIDEAHTILSKWQPEALETGTVLYF